MNLGRIAVIVQKNSTKNEIKKLFFVIFSGVTGACLFALVMLYYYGPSGRYIVKNVLLSPALIQNLSYQERSIKTEKSTLFSFDTIDFSYYDNHKKVRIAIPVSKYAKFFDLINNELSLDEMTNHAPNFFTEDKTSKLLIKVRAESNEQKIFQEIELTTNDFYRIQLRVQAGTSTGWAYFYQPGIYQETLKLFIKIP